MQIYAGGRILENKAFCMHLPRFSLIAFISKVFFHPDGYSLWLWCFRLSGHERAAFMKLFSEIGICHENKQNNVISILFCQVGLI